MKKRSSHAGRSSSSTQDTSSSGRKASRKRDPLAQPVHQDGARATQSVAGGLNAAEVVELMSKVQHPVRLDDLIRFLDLSRRDKRAVEDLLDALQAQGRVLRLRGGKWVAAAQANVITGVLSIQRSGAGFVTPDTLSVVDTAEKTNIADTENTADTTENIGLSESSKNTGKPQSFRKTGAPGSNRERAGMQPDIFIPPGFFGDAWHGDRVEVVTQASLRQERRGGRNAARSPQGRSPEGRIVRVLERRQKELAVYATRRGTARGVLCRPADPRLDFLLDVDVSGLSGMPKTGELLLVTPGDKIDDGLWTGTAQVSLGLEEDASVQERLVKLNHAIPLDFPPNVLAEAVELEQRAFGATGLHGLAQAVSSEESAEQDLDGFRPLVDSALAPPLSAISTVSTARRQDLRSVPFVTIDGADARDFDDAVFVTPVTHASNPAVKWELWVAIADVSYFVRPDRKPGAALDREARERGNSYYFPTSVEPMLPEVLSNGLCSLRPGEDRLVMTARIGFDERGVPRCSAFFPGVIRSRARLTYEGVQAVLPNDPDSPAVSVSPEYVVPLEVHPYIQDAAALARLLRRQRQERGSLDFDLPEAQFVVDRASGRVTNILRRERLFSHRIIEECMLAANEAVARFLTEKGLPFPYRVHPAPDPERLTRLFRTLATTDLAQVGHLATLFITQGKDRVSATGTSGGSGKRGQFDQRGQSGQSGSRGHSSPEPEKTINPDVLREILAQAAGTPQEYLVGRLVLRSMMQARYSPEPDAHFGLASACYCHFTSPIRRYADLLVHRALGFALGSSRTPVLAGQKLLAVTDQCNARERAATEAEREIARRLGCLLLQERVGETFTGVISGVTDFGFFVEFDALPVEGMVRLDSFQDDWFEYDADRQELLGASTGRRFRLGQAVSVRLADVHLGRLEVNLELLSSATDTARKSSSRRSAGGRAEKGVAQERGRNGVSPRRKRR